MGFEVFQACGGRCGIPRGRLSISGLGMGRFNKADLAAVGIVDGATILVDREGPSLGAPFLVNAIGVAAMGQQEKSFFDWAGEKGESLLGGGVLGGNWRLPKWHEDWKAEYPPGGGRYIPGVPPPEAKEMRLTAAGVGSRERSIRFLDREIARDEALSRRQARKAAGERARELYRRGYEVTPEDRARLEAEDYERIAGAHTSQARKTRDAIRAELEARRPRTTMTEDELAGIGRAVPAKAAQSKAEGPKETTSLLSRLVERATEQVTLTKQLLGALGGAEAAVTRASTG